MSAFTVTREHIAVLLHAGLGIEFRPMSWLLPTDDAGTPPIEPTTHNGISAGWAPGSRIRSLAAASVDATGQMLLDQNIASVNHHYQEDDLALYTHTAPRSLHRQPVEILKAIACYRYQACETPDWATSEAFAFCAALEAATITRLPGYESAAWAIARETPTLTEQLLTIAPGH